MDVIWDSLQWEWGGNPQPDKDAVFLPTELLKATKAAGVFPEAASSGYFPTVRLFWQSGRVEIEVFPDCFEVYVLPRKEGKEFTVSKFEAISLPIVVEKIKETLLRLAD